LIVLNTNKIQFLFTSSKGAVEGLTRTLAAEFAPNIRVNCIAPSITNTPLAEKLLNNETKVKASEDRHPLKKLGVQKRLLRQLSFCYQKNPDLLQDK
jgi:NAD(P)-dependent dehydrogenase (short-subunit alcohol dehydrogenase family)